MPIKFVSAWSKLSISCPFSVRTWHFKESCPQHSEQAFSTTPLAITANLIYLLRSQKSFAAVYSRLEVESWWTRIFTFPAWDSCSQIIITPSFYLVIYSFNMKISCIFIRWKRRQIHFFFFFCCFLFNTLISRLWIQYMALQLDKLFRSSGFALKNICSIVHRLLFRTFLQNQT